MENARGEHRIGACGDRWWEVRSLASSARRDKRDIYLSTHRPDHLQVKAVGGAIGVHGVQQNFADALLDPAARPVDCIQASGSPASASARCQAKTWA